MSFKYPLLPPKDIIKAMKKLGFENAHKKAVMQNMLIIIPEKFLLFQCIMKSQEEH